MTPERQASNLPELGQILESRRKDIGISRALLARKIGISTSYAWMIERARGRKGIEPSYPSEVVLERWADELRFTNQERRRARSLAGYESGISVFEESDREMIIENIDSILNNPALTTTQRSNALHTIHSFTAWLRTEYERSGQK